MTLHHVTYHVTAVSHASSLSKRKIKQRKEKENQYKIKEKKIVNVPAFHNSFAILQKLR